MFDDLLRVLGLAAALLLAMPARAQVFHTIRSWPNAKSCNGTLQACVDVSSPDDSITIQTNGPIDESITVDKSLSIAAAPGFEPVFATRKSIAGTPSATSARTITIVGLAFEQGTIVFRNGAAPLSLLLRNNRFHEIPSGTGAGIYIESENGGSLHVEISGNEIDEPGTASGFAQNGILIFTGSPTTAAITGNTFDMKNTDGGGAIAVFAEPSAGVDPDVDVDVIGNRIEGDQFNYGIGLSQSGAGTLTARVIDNAVSGQSTVGGIAGAIAARGNAGVSDLTVVNNTVALCDQGIRADGRADLGAAMVGVIANNVVAFNGLGLHIDPDFAAAITNDHNLSFGNFFNEFLPGIGTLTVDPLLESMISLRLQAASPARDAGANERVPADIVDDLDGNPRILGSAVDIGAYEAPEPSAPLSGVGAALALAILTRSRRRRRTLEKVDPGSPNGEYDRRATAAPVFE